MNGKDISVDVVDADRIKSKEYKAINMTGKFPMLETPEGNISETIAIAKYLAHGHATLLGANAVEQAQVDQWLFYAISTALPPQFPAIMAIHGWSDQITSEAFTASTSATKAVCKTINGALTADFLTGANVTVADVVLASFFIVSMSTTLDGGFRKAMPKFAAWFARVTALPEFVAVAGHIKPCAKALKPVLKAAEKKEVKKEAPKPKADDDEEPAEKKKEVNPLDALPPSSFDLFNFKTFFVNHKDKKGEAIDEMLKIFDPEGFSFYYLQYEKFGNEGQVLFKTTNLCKGFLQRFDSFRKHAFARHCVIGEEPNLEIEGVWLWRGQGIP